MRHKVLSELRKLAKVLLGLVILLVLAQLAYPNSRTRPFVKVDGRSFGFATSDELKSRLHELDKQPQALKLSKQSYKTSAVEIGISTDAAKTSSQALEYSWRQRLVPFSLFSFGTTNRAPDRVIDDKVLSKYLEKLVSENTIPATNPVISRTAAGDFEAKPGVDGSTYGSENLKSILLQLPISTSELGVTADELLKPAVSDEKASQVAAKLKGNEQALGKLIADWRAEYPGAETAVAFREISGFGRIVQASENTSFFAASLYKLFVAHYVLHGIETKTINPADAILGRDIESCVRVMIVNSDNPCPEALANRFGWSKIDAFAASNGFGASNVEYGDNTVTAASMADFLVRLNARELLDETQTATLLGYMKRQVYRSGIPAGLPGATVEDKVGFYAGTWHDAAIVRSSKATYALVVLTEATGSGAIANLAKRIDALLEPTF